jgi:hypothetical protein
VPLAHVLANEGVAVGQPRDDVAQAVGDQDRCSRGKAALLQVFGKPFEIEAGEDDASRTVLVESSINGSFGLREGKWKLALCPDSGGWSYPRPGKDSTDGMPRFQLFDVAADPAEKTNVLSHHPEIVQRLGGMMGDYIVNGRSTPGAPQKNTPVKSWQQIKWLEEFGKVQR